jgi:molybdate transport system regulatory protein
MAGPKGSKYYNIFLDYNIFLMHKESGNKIINNELFQILSSINSDNSIAKVAENKGMSYRKAWGLIKEAEKELNFCIVERQRGGLNGGTSKLSPEGEKLINAYNQLQAEFCDSINNVTKKFFNTINV